MGLGAGGVDIIVDPGEIRNHEIIGQQEGCFGASPKMAARKKNTTNDRMDFNNMSYPPNICHSSKYIPFYHR